MTLRNKDWSSASPALSPGRQPCLQRPVENRLAFIVLGWSMPL
jgi:hypothetical protein